MTQVKPKTEWTTGDYLTYASTGEEPKMPSAHPIDALLAKAGEGGVPSLREIAGLGLPAENRLELELAIVEIEDAPDPAKATAAAERLINRLPAAYADDDYRDGRHLSPRDLAARMPRT